ncbi:MAG TPA: SDR family oxidoreductase [Tepidisphaeraceae bacterium]|jgi:2-hydroxycyclohexanecarboxyl-CoA dehydrogenase
MDLNLKDHIVLITGGASGIGLATARAFALEGARIAIWDLQPPAPSDAEFFNVIADITDESAIHDALRQTAESLGPIDHLVHAAAIGSGRFGFPFTNLTPADWTRVLQVNIMGMTNIAHAIAPQMVGRGRGTMTFVASVAGQMGSQTDPPYSASKAANINFAQCMAKDLAPHGVRVNTVCPGMVKTPLNRSVWQAWHDQTAPQDRQTYEQWADKKIRSVVPLGKWQTPEAIADMIVFLSSDRAEHVTGQTINVDGGFVMHS